MPEFAPIPQAPVSALSLLQPWASLLVWGKTAKAIETRSFSVRHRGPLVIHASKGRDDLDDFLDVADDPELYTDFDRHVVAVIQELFPDAKPPYADLFPTGVVLGIGTLVDCKRTEAIRDGLSERERAFGGYGDNRWGWYFENMRMFEMPVPARGSLGIWTWTPPKVAPSGPKMPLPKSAELKQKTLFSGEDSVSGINLALMTLPNDSPLANASWEEKKQALNLNDDGSPKVSPMGEYPRLAEAFGVPTVVIASTNPVKIRAVQAAVEKMFDMSPFEFVGVSVPSGVSNQPMSSDETRQGAENRARAALAAKPEAQLAFGIEGGIEDDEYGMASFAWVAVTNGVSMHVAKSATFYLPEEVALLVRQGKELGEADDIVFRKENSKQVNGAIGLLTNNTITREELYTPAVIMALIPLKNEPLTWEASAKQYTPPDFYVPVPEAYPHISAYDLSTLTKLLNDVYAQAYQERVGRNVEWVGGLQEEVYAYVDRMLHAQRTEIDLLKSLLNANPHHFRVLDMAILPHPVDCLFDAPVRIGAISGVDAHVRRVSPEGRLSDDVEIVALADLKPYTQIGKARFDTVFFAGQTISVNRSLLRDPRVQEHLPAKPIAAIKEYRVLANAGLKEAKLAIEYAIEEMAVESLSAPAAAQTPFPTGTTALHIDEPVIILADSKVDHRLVYFLEDHSRDAEWVQLRDLRSNNAAYELEEALEVMMREIETKRFSLNDANRVIGELEQKVNALKTDVRVQSATIATKNDQVMRLDADLREANARLEQIKPIDPAAAPGDTLGQYYRVVGQHLSTISKTTEDMVRVDDVPSADVAAWRSKINNALYVIERLLPHMQQINTLSAADYIDLREELSKTRDTLSKMILERNEAQLAAVNAMLQLPAAEPAQEAGMIKSNRFYDPSDEDIEGLRNEGWRVVYEVCDLSAKRHFMRFEKVVPYPQPDLDEDETETAAAAPLPVTPEPPMRGEIVFAEPVPAPVVVVGQTPIADALSEYGIDAVKAAMNEMAKQNGLLAGTQALEQSGITAGKQFMDSLIQTRW